MRKLLLMWFFMVAAAAAPAAAQAISSVAAAGKTPSPTLVELRLKDGSVVYGAVEREDADRIVLKTIGGSLVDVPRSEIAVLRSARGTVVDGEFRPADANATRLLFSPTARSLKPGEGYLGMYEFLLPFVQVGVTDRFSMGAGTPLLFIGDESSRPVWLTPKYQFYRGTRTSAAAGVMHFVVFGEDSRLGLAYTVITTGTDDDALTTGVGWAYAQYQEDRFDPSCAAPASRRPTSCPRVRTTETTGSPVGMIGGEHRVSQRIKIVTENYAFTHGGIVSVGVRFLGDRLSADLGVFAPLTGDGFVLAPVVNFVWTFGS